MDDRTLMMVLRLFHIIGGLFWVGAAMTIAWFILPAARASGRDSGRFMQNLMENRRLSMWFGIAAAATVLSGLWMYWRYASASNGVWTHSHSAMAYGLGGLAAIIAAILGGGVSGAAGRKIGALAREIETAGGPPSAEQMAMMARLQARAGWSSSTAAILLILAAAAMAVARYI